MYFVYVESTSNSPDSFESASIIPLNTPTSSVPATNTESGDGLGSPTSASGSTRTRTLRGPNKGLNLDKIISTGKIKISFNFGEKIPAKNVLEFSEGIGIAVRAHAPLKNVSTWRNISQEHKEACHLRLLHWFEIEDWTTERVQTLVDKQFQKSYRQWRNTLHTEYKKFVKNGQDPRLFSPRLEVDIDSWKAICDFFESTKFKVRSEINSTNRRRAPFSHTSGKIRALTRYRKMVNPSKIDLWRMTHVRKNGVFVNSQANMTYRKMNLLESETMDEGGEPMSEDQILVAALGRRSGYQKGMGDGVEVPRRGNFILGAQQDPELKKKLSDTESKLCKTQSKLSETQIELGLAMGKIDKLTEDLESQKEISKTNDQRFVLLQEQMHQMQEAWLKMQANNIEKVVIP
ncbi:hypothetical protein ACJIZ3_019656 [Penstemon smallii]|uniref:Transposase, Ptta/En/Spm, plant n=1 Tax=Penstemon smallii TaxID=265156 RepID=A0ABD3T1S5_9LAMI